MIPNDEIKRLREIVEQATRVHYSPDQYKIIIDADIVPRLIEEIECRDRVISKLYAQKLEKDAEIENLQLEISMYRPQAAALRSQLSSATQLIEKIENCLVCQPIADNAELIRTALEAIAEWRKPK